MAVSSVGEATQAKPGAVALATTPGDVREVVDVIRSGTEQSGSSAALSNRCNADAGRDAPEMPLPSGP